MSHVLAPLGRQNPGGIEPSSVQNNDDYFDDHWLLYSKLYANNYLYHRDIYPVLIRLLQSQPDLKRLLELGCGDAHWTRQVLQSIGPVDYTGLDICTTALERARANLEGLNCRVDLRHSDLMAALVEPATPYHGIFTSFCLHHLAEPDKQWVFQRVHSWLAPQGSFYMIDLVRRSDESRQQYIARQEAQIEARWTATTAEERERVRLHWQESDFPETLPTLEQMARNAGFTSMETAYLDPTEAHALTVFRKTS